MQSEFLTVFGLLVDGGICFATLKSLRQIYSEGSVAQRFSVLDLKSGGPWFKSSTLLSSGFVLGSPEFNSPLPRCVHSQLLSLPPAGIINSFCSICSICLFIYSVPS